MTTTQIDNLSLDGVTVRLRVEHYGYNYGTVLYGGMCGALGYKYDIELPDGEVIGLSREEFTIPVTTT